jgi:hypothetical protein
MLAWHGKVLFIKARRGLAEQATKEDADQSRPASLVWENQEMRYRYEIAGTATDEQTWATEGIVETYAAGDFPAVPGLALENSFMKLTAGQAVYGHPGFGCNGPYGITRMVIEKIEDGGKS